MQAKCVLTSSLNVLIFLLTYNLPTLEDHIILRWDFQHKIPLFSVSSYSHSPLSSHHSFSSPPLTFSLFLSNVCLYLLTHAPPSPSSFLCPSRNRRPGQESVGLSACPSAGLGVKWRGYIQLVYKVRPFCHLPTTPFAVMKLVSTMQFNPSEHMHKKEHNRRIIIGNIETGADIVKKKIINLVFGQSKQIRHGKITLLVVYLLPVVKCSEIPWIP